MVLAPFPQSGGALTSAITLLSSRLAGDPPDDVVAALGAVAGARVAAEGSQAPDSIKNEAVIRYAGYLLQASGGAIRSKSAGGFAVEHVTNHAAAFRNSGAYGLLSPWKVRRGIAI